MVPTKDRNHSSLLLRYKNEGILVDCGEGTQRQLKHAGIPITKVTKILISHWHGDHVLGLPGVIQTLGSSEKEAKVEIYGPKSTKERYNHMQKAFDIDADINVKVHDVTKRKFLETEDYYLESLPLEHSVDSIGFSFVEKDKINIDTDYLKKNKIPNGDHLLPLKEGKDAKYKTNKIPFSDATKVTKGKKVTIIMDTKLTKNAIELAEESDLLITESTYANKLKNKAEQYSHMTARDAATIANESGSKKLILTHFSQRYKNTQEIEEDAREIFDNVICAKDFMRFEL